MDDPQRAMQSIVLEGLDGHVGFDAQVRSIALLKAHVHGEFNSQAPSDSGTYLRFQRRVFTKVCLYGHLHLHSYANCSLKVTPTLTAPSIPLNHYEDPEGRADSVKNMWRITSRPVLGFQDSNNHVYACDHKRFRKGDFVEVLASLDIANYRKGGVSVVNVRLKLHRVFQLLPQTEAAAVVAAQALEPDAFAFDQQDPAPMAVA